MTDPGLQRWRLILGEPAGGCCGGLSGDAKGRDAALDWLYGRDEDLTERGVRRGGTVDQDERSAGRGPSALTTVDWLDGIHRLFPKETIERLEADAIERYQIVEVVTDPGLGSTWCRTSRWAIL